MLWAHHQDRRGKLGSSYHQDRLSSRPPRASHRCHRETPHCQTKVLAAPLQ